MPSYLEAIPILPRLLVIEGAHEHARLDTLRRVWGGRALMGLDPAAYNAVFRDGKGNSVPPRPAYTLSDGGRTPDGAWIVRWTLIGQHALAHDASLCRAWDIAGGMGLGHEDARTPYLIREMRELSPAGEALPPSFRSRGWPLAEAPWPLNGPPETTPCRLAFPQGLRILHNRKFLRNPSLPDLAYAAEKRILRFLPEALQPGFRELSRALTELALRTPAQARFREAKPLQSGAAAKRNEKEYWNVEGCIDLHEGPGPLWPLLAAAQWLHIGAYPACGLGKLEILPLEPATPNSPTTPNAQFEPR